VVNLVGEANQLAGRIHPVLRDSIGDLVRSMNGTTPTSSRATTRLWSVARGLAREEAGYRALLAQADGPRGGDRDGRGNLTQRGLIEFCKFFLDQSLDQIRFMGGLIEPSVLLTRMEIHVEEEIRAKRLLRGSFAVLREAVIGGEVERSKIPSLTGYEERGARNVTAALVERGMLTASSHRAPLRLAFPANVAERWFPNGNYPVDVANARC